MLLGKRCKVSSITSEIKVRKIPKRDVTLDLRKSKAAGGLVATVFGATGFLGRYIVHRLGIFIKLFTREARSGAQIVVPFRGEERSYNHLKLAGEVGQIVPMRFTIRDKELIEKAVARSNIVINLIGADWETRNFSFHDVHVTATENIAEACRKFGVGRVVHFSCVNADINSPSKFAASKAEGENVFRRILPEGTIVRPTWMFGDYDRLLNNFGKMATTWIPFFMLEENRVFQPVYVKDVASTVIAILGDAATFGKTFELGGPQVYSYGDFADYVMEKSRRGEKKMITFPKQMEWAKNLVAAWYEHAMYPIVTRDRLKYLSKDLLVSPAALDFSYFNIKPTALTETPILNLAAFYPPVDRSEFI